MEIKKYLEKIGSNNKKEDMVKLAEILDEVICELKKYHKPLYDKYKMDLYVMAYGKEITEEMAEKIIRNMKPYGVHWSKEDVKAVKEQYGITDIPLTDFWLVMNSAYNDFHNVFGDNIDLYVKYSNSFIKDEDAEKGKLFTYFMNIPKKDEE